MAKWRLDDQNTSVAVLGGSHSTTAELFQKSHTSVCTVLHVQTISESPTYPQRVKFYPENLMDMTVSINNKINSVIKHRVAQAICTWAGNHDNS